MRIVLEVIAGPSLHRSFAFEQHDLFLVGRGEDVHFQIPNDLQLSRRHFMVEVNPPSCMAIDLNSKSGIEINGVRSKAQRLRNGDTIRAGATVFAVGIEGSEEWFEASQTTEVQLLPPTAVLSSSVFPAIPGYLIVREIGRGGMGVVYLATRQADGQRVAVKTLLPATAASAQAMQRFLREAEILKELDHPHIVRFTDMGEVAGLLWFGMEFVDGPDAWKVIKQNGPLPVGDACRLARETISALIYAHSKSFVHRDIKPHNILLETHATNGTYRARLSDFGLARTYQTSQISGLTLRGESGGTPMYMPPEQVRQFREARPAADQYSIAATLYFLLTGGTIFEPIPDIVSLMFKVLDEAPVPIRSRRADIPAPLAEAIHRSLSKNAADRFLHLSELDAAIAPFTN